MKPRGHVVEDENAPRAEEILRKEGFRNLIRMPRFHLYDYEAERGGKTVYIEVRCRSDDMAPLFTFRRSKLENLKELKRRSRRQVYILLMWRNQYSLCEVDDFPPRNLHPMKVVLFGKPVQTYRLSLKGEVTEEEEKTAIRLREEGWTIKDIAEKLGRSPKTIRKHLPPHLRRMKIPRRKAGHPLPPGGEGPAGRYEVLYIRCTGWTKRRFRLLRGEVERRLGLSVTEDFLNYMLDLVELLLAREREEAVVESY